MTDMNKKKKRRKGIVCLCLGLLLLAGALSLTLYNLWDANRADREAQDIVGQLKDKIQEMGDSLLSDQEMPAVEIDGNRYIGLLEIPSLELCLPVMESWDYDKLKLSPCRYSGSYFTDDLVIAGHNYIRHFGPLKSLGLGSDVYFINVQGRTLHYIVDNIETLRPGQIEEMTGGDWDLTLFTCTLGGQSRCTVRCIRKDS